MNNIKIKNALIWSGIFLLCLGCHNKKSVDNVAGFTILKVQYITSANLSDLIEPDFKYIPLETANNPIGVVSEIIKTNEQYVISDENVAKKIFIYDLKGNFSNSFGIEGSGPGEYGQLTDMAIVNDQIMVSDGSNFSMLTYNLEGDFIKEESIPIWVREFFQWGDRIVVHSPTNFTFDDDSKWGTDVLKVMSHDFENVYTSYIPYEENHDDAGLKGQIVEFHGQVSYVKPLRGEIYSINKDNKLFPRYKYDFGKYSWPITMDEITQDQEMAEETFLKNNVMSLIHRLLETSEYIVFQTYMTDAMILDDGEDDKWLVIHKKGSEECFAIKNIINDIDGGVFSFPIASSDDFLLSAISMELMGYNNPIDGINDKHTEKQKDFIQMTDSIDFDDSPILMKFKLKPNIKF